MKKLLNISVIAALAVLPLAANATDFTVADPAHTDSPTAAETNPGYQLAQENEAADGKLATAGYVKGAYNQAMKAINKVATTAGSALKASDIVEGNTDGAISVNGTAVSVHGLGSAAFVNTGAIAGTANTYDPTVSGLTATTIKGAIDELATATADLADSENVSYDGTTSGLTADNVQAAIDEVAETAGSAADKSLSNINPSGQNVIKGLAAAGAYDNTESGLEAETIQAAIDEVAATAGSALTSSDLTPYAKKTGVTQTISASTISGTVPVVTTWGTDATDTVAIAASITGATYSEPAPVVPEPEP